MLCGIVCLWDNPNVSNIVETDASSNTVENAHLAGMLPGFGSQRKSFLSYLLWSLYLFLSLVLDLPVKLYCFQFLYVDLCLAVKVFIC